MLKASTRFIRPSDYLVDKSIQATQFHGEVIGEIAEATLGQTQMYSLWETLHVIL